MTIKRILGTTLLSLLLVGVGRANDIKGKVTASGFKSPADIAVYAEPTGSFAFAIPKEHTTVDQKGLKFNPHVTVILKGTTVDFLNSDSVGHNVYWPSISGNKKLSHNLGTWPQGQRKSFQFNDTGTATLLCNVHPEMSGYIVIVTTTYSAVTDKDGNYAIKGVPVGKYTLKTWSEEGKPTSQAIEVKDGGTAVNLTVKK